MQAIKNIVRNAATIDDGGKYWIVRVYCPSTETRLKQFLEDGWVYYDMQQQVDHAVFFVDKFVEAVA